MSYWKAGLVLVLIIIASAFVAPQHTLAQSGLQQQQQDLPRDPELERDAKHNLEVARFYLKRKAYKGAVDRLLEITYTYPKFSHLDEVLSLLGDTYQKMDDKKEAARFYQKLVDLFPDSALSKDARKHLADLPPAPKDSDPPRPDLKNSND